MSPVFIGRQDEIAQVLADLRTGSSIVVKGRAGIGKRALLRQVAERLGEEKVCLRPSMSTPKAMVQDLAEQIHEAVGLVVPARLIPPRFRPEVQRTGRVPWHRIKRSLLREPAREILALVIASIRGRTDLVLFVETLEVPPSQADMLHDLAELMPVAAAMDENNRRNKVVRLLWRFRRTIELGPLTADETRRIVEHWLEAHPIAFDDERVETAFVRAVVRDSGGIPAAVEGMLTAAANDREVTRARIRHYQHEAAAVYWDMTPLLVVLVAVFMAMRYISRGADMQELLVLAGVGSSLFWMALFFVRRMSGRR